MAHVGLVQETKNGERRVALTPSAVGQLVRNGHQVTVEASAGTGAGFTDTDYVASGAVIGDRDSTWGAQLVVKVKEPQAEEFARLGADTTLFAFLHLAAEPALSAALVAAGTRAYAFEDLKVDGRFSLLHPMSQIAGRLAGIIGAQLLTTAAGGRGVLAGGIDGAPAAQAVVVGVGAAGDAAARNLRGVGMQVTGIDLDADRLAALVDEGVLHRGLVAGSAEADAAIVAADVLIGAALRPGHRAPVVVSRQQVAAMQDGSAIIDIAIDQGGCIETSRATSLSEPTYVEVGVTHYCVPNMPGQVPVTASQALSSALVEPTLQLAAELDAGAPSDLHGSLAVVDGTVLPR